MEDPQHITAKFMGMDGWAGFRRDQEYELTIVRDGDWVTVVLPHKPDTSVPMTAKAFDEAWEVKLRKR